MRLNRLILGMLAAAMAVVAIAVAMALSRPEAQELQSKRSGFAADSEVIQPSLGKPESTAPRQFVDVRSRRMTMLAGGLPVGDEAPTAWSHLVLHAVPRVAEGDVDRVSAMVNRLTGLFHLVIVAKVGSDGDACPNSLEEVAIGLATDVSGVETTVSSQSSGDSNAQLDFMERTALIQNEASLKSAQQVARTKTMFVFDAETIMWREGDHLRTIHRHALLVDPKSGRLATTVWALAPISKGRYRCYAESLQLLPNGLREDRLLHVDASKFTLGIPTQQAFALVRVPQGQTLSLSPELEEVVESRFDRPEDALQLELALRAAIGWDRPDERLSVRVER